MKDQTRQLAELWCLLNGDKWPEEFGNPGFMDHKAVKWGAFLAIDAVAGFAGQALWDERDNEGVHPATGEPYPERKPKRRKRAPASA